MASLLAHIGKKGLWLAVIAAAFALLCHATPAHAEFYDYQSGVDGVTTSVSPLPGTSALSGSKIPDGTYNIPARSNSSMGRVYHPDTHASESCQIIVSGGAITVRFAFTDAFTYAYCGSAKTAASLSDDEGNPSPSYLKGTVSGGYCTYAISIHSLNKGVSVAAYAGGSGSKCWWNRELVFDQTDEIMQAIEDAELPTYTVSYHILIQRDGQAAEDKLVFEDKAKGTRAYVISKSAESAARSAAAAVFPSGYEMDGWYLASDLSGSPSSSGGSVTSSLEKDLVLYASVREKKQAVEPEPEDEPQDPGNGGGQGSGNGSGTGTSTGGSSGQTTPAQKTEKPVESVDPNAHKSHVIPIVFPGMEEESGGEVAEEIPAVEVEEDSGLTQEQILLLLIALLFALGIVLCLAWFTNARKVRRA